MIKNLAWRKAPASGGQGGNCVEVATNASAGEVRIRDSKNPDGHQIRIDPRQFEEFVRRVRSL